MKVEFIEGYDGTRHVHLGSCDHPTRKNALDRQHAQCAGMSDDDILCAVWADFIGDEEPTDDELDGYAEMTVYRECLEHLLPPQDSTPLSGAEPDDESSGNAKADAFMDEADAAGWAVEFETEDEFVRVTAKRECIGSDGIRTTQVLDLTWENNRMVDAHHLSGRAGDVAKRLSSVSGAIKILYEGYPKRVSSQRIERDEPVKRIPKEKLPFDIEEAYDDEILDACRGKTLVWLNSTSENYESATVIGKNPAHYKIETGAAGRAILSFVSVEGGFRSVALDNLIQVK